MSYSSQRPRELVKPEILSSSFFVSTENTGEDVDGHASAWRHHGYKVPQLSGVLYRPAVSCVHGKIKTHDVIGRRAMGVVVRHK